MNNRQIMQNFIRRIATSVPVAMKITVRLGKASETAVGEGAATKSIPRSYRALRKMDPKDLPFRTRTPLSIGAYALLAIPVTTFGLGVWQIDRRRQKLAKIHALEVHSKSLPVSLPLDLRDLDKMEYTPIKVVGEFLHNEELIIKPRHRHDEFEIGGVMTNPNTRMNDVGAQVITPFKVADRNYKILIQRGWIPLSHIDPATREAGQIKGQVEVVGLARGNETRPKFSPENDPSEGEWHYRDVDLMARLRNSAPVYLEAIKDSTVHGGPIGGQTILRIRNEHFSYIITWFSLSAITGWMWFHRYIRKLPKI